MTNYKLEDFHTWLENNPEQERNIGGWDYATYLATENNWTRILGELNPPNVPLKKVILEWKQGVDLERERERERERFPKEDKLVW